MAQESRSRQLGDVENNAPEYWEWGGTASEPHAVVMFFGGPDGFDAFVQNSRGAAWEQAFETLRSLGTADLDGVEPFGFTDGISQPEIDWDQRRETTHAQFDYTNIAALGEFLLGYPNEYGKITERPLLDPNAANAELLDAEDEPGKKDLGRNGTYLVMRQLRQDVEGFWNFVNKQTGGNATESEKLAAAMVGGTKNGDPLGADSEQSHSGNRTRRTAQKISSHSIKTRRARDARSARMCAGRIRATQIFPNAQPVFSGNSSSCSALVPKGFRDDLMSSVRFHRILRRGREYGCEHATCRLRLTRRNRKSKACTSFASMQTSRASSSSCKMRG